MNLGLLLLASPFAAAGGLWLVRNWREAVKVALVVLVVEGAIRKWILPGAQDLVYFAKDGILVAGYLGYLGSPEARDARGLVPQTLTALLVGGALVGLLQIFNPNLPNLLVGIFGFKTYFLYVPLLWIVPATFRSREELWHFLSWYALLAIPVGMLAVLQFASPAGSALNTYARDSDPGAIVRFGSSRHVRVTSTFSYITGYVSYLFAIAMLLLTLLWTSRWKIRGHLALHGALGLTLVGMLMSGSRAPMLMFAVIFPLFWWLAVARDREGFQTGSRLLVVVVVLGLLVAYGAGDAVSAFYSRATSAGDTTSRIISPLTAPFRVASDAGLLGIGIGATHQAATVLVDGVREATWLEGHIVEAETGRVMLELGVFGFLLIYAARIAMILLALRQAQTLGDRFCRMIAVACLLFFLAHLPTGIIFNVTSAVFYWTMGGFLFLAMRLDREVSSRATPMAWTATRGAAAGRPAPVGSTPSAARVQSPP